VLLALAPPQFQCLARPPACFLVWVSGQGRRARVSSQCARVKSFDAAWECGVGDELSHEFVEQVTGRGGV